MSNFEFIPNEKQIQESNIFQFMKKHGMSTLEELSQKAKIDLEWFWESVDKDIGIVWDKPYTKTLDDSKGIAWSKWFIDGKTNIYKSSVEKYAKKNPQKIAYYFVSEDGSTSKISYSELNSKVTKLANALKSLGVKKGDVIAIYLPMIEEAILAILAAAKIGAIQTTIFSGYSSQSLHVRLQDCKAKILFISDGFYRKGKPVSQKEIMETAIKNTNIEKTIIVSYKGIDTFSESKDIIPFEKIMSSHDDSCVTE
ncbi:MAG: AMP-binding protein, partial [Nitrosopumilus sp.]|nr:AMP-binding protein [Nitrosopumilus sp.]NNL53224.1 AMP-binding protein [Nitrosopumilus sp.]